MSIGQSSSFTGFNVLETFNSRLQPSEIKASSSAGNAIDITYNFVDPVTTHNAGHVYGITNNLNSSRSQAFTFDQVNRISRRAPRPRRAPIAGGISIPTTPGAICFRKPAGHRRTIAARKPRWAP